MSSDRIITPTGRLVFEDKLKGSAEQFMTKMQEAAEFTFTEHPGVTADTMILKVPYEEGSNFVALSAVVRAAQLECKES